MTRRIGFVSGAAVAGVLLAGTLLTAAVSAQQAPGPGWGPGYGPGYGMMGGYGRMGGPGVGPMVGFDAEHDAVAQALGISAQELWTLRASGKSIAQIASDKGVPLDQVTAAMLQVHKDWLDQQVQAGALTQAQADAWLSQAQTRIQAVVQATGGFGPFGGMGMGFRGRGPGFGPGYGMGFGPGYGPRWATPTPTS